MIGRLTRTVDRISTTATEERAFLTVNNLKVAFPTEDGLVQAVDDVSFKLEKGKTPKYEDIVDLSLAEEAIKELGVYKGPVCPTEAIGG